MSCGGGPTVQPTPIDDPIVTCPSDISVIAHNGLLPTVAFDVPAALKGVPPVTVTCTPSSGSQFANGVTTVTCEAIDVRSHKGSCTFNVVVTPIPQLLKTKFMAFGDSITEGKTSLRAPGIVVPGQCPNPSGFCFNNSPSYVEQLSVKLAARYQDQATTLIAEGLGDEEAGQGKLRLPGLLSAYKPDALLLLEGANELLHADFTGQTPAIDSAANALRVMVQTAKGRGVRVFIGTLLPMDPSRRSTQAPSVPILNERIKAIAAQEKETVTLVDLYAAVPLAMIGGDGLHPKPEAYSVMADEWMKAIQAAFEAKTSAVP